MPSLYETFRVDPRQREPLVEFMMDALHKSDCVVLHRSPPNEAPFRISFITPWGERMGIIAYAFFANSKETRNRPADEHRFQMKYGKKDFRLHRLWQDPFGIYTTLCLGINLNQGFFVGADPVLNSPTLFFISKEYKQFHVNEILSRGWHAWTRLARKRKKKEEMQEGRGELSLLSDLEEEGSFQDGHEVLVGGRSDNFLRYVLFERDALGEDQGHRQLLAERYADVVLTESTEIVTAGRPLLAHARLHELEHELDLSAGEVMELIARAPRLKMAVRGWVAEQHLRRLLETLPEVSEVSTIEQDGRPDFEVALKRGRRPILVECKNVLRTTNRAGYPRLDFMRTRASKTDPCSRYYSPREFDVVAACLHAHTEAWEFAARRTLDMAPHPSCDGKLDHRVVVDSAWERELSAVLQAAAG